MSEGFDFQYSEYRQLCDKLSRANERIRMLEMDNDRLKAIVIKQKAQLWDFRGPEKIRADALEDAAKIADEMREKHSSPTGDAYSCGTWDQGVRIAGKIRALAGEKP